MAIRSLIAALFTLLLSLHASSAAALTMDEFSKICQSSASKCSDHPIIQAYVGGALDLVATLDERTNYLEKKLYCKKPNKLFDVPTIIRFMEQQSEQQSEQYAKDNAMLALVHYFKEHGGCQHE